MQIKPELLKELIGVRDVTVPALEASFKDELIKPRIMMSMPLALELMRFYVDGHKALNMAKPFIQKHCGEGQVEIMDQIQKALT